MRTTPPPAPTACGTPDAAECLAHGKACGRPSVEGFTAAEQARFEAFCGALLRTLNSPDPEERKRNFPGASIV